MNNEEKLIYNITNNIWNSEYLLNICDCVGVDWSIVLKIAVEQGIFPIVFPKVLQHLPTKEKMTYIAHKMRLQSRIKIVIEEAHAISKMFTDASIQHAIVKGFVLSNLIYGDYLVRQFGDIDFMVSEIDIVSACYKMESAGYYEEFLNDIETSGLTLTDYHKNMWYSGDINDIGDTEKAFRGKNAMVELKKEKPCYGVSEVSDAISRCVDVIICGYKFKTLSVEDIFIFTLENMFHNFYTTVGIRADYLIRDIVDFHKFILEYKDIFTLEYMDIIEKGNHKNHLALCIDILRKYFDCKAFSKIPTILSSLKSEPENIFEFNIGWQISFFDRLFKSELRISEFNWHLFHKCKTFKEKPLDLTVPPWDITKGVVDTPIEIWMDSFSFDILKGKIHFGLGYDTDNFYISFKIPLSFPDLSISYGIPHTGSVIGDINNIGFSFDLMDKKITNIESSIHISGWHTNLFDNYYVVSILSPKHENIPVTNSNQNDYPVNITIGYQKGDRLICRLGGYNDAYKFCLT